MIPRLASPSVCVIDDEEPDYRPILDALLKMGIGCIHVRGESESQLPANAFVGLRIVFTDLYLNTTSGKTAATHTANVFRRIVSADTAPVLVVIWSKHTDEKDNENELPPDDQPTAAESFKDALLEAEPRFRQRLIFTVMPKPKPSERPEEEGKWIEILKSDIENKLAEFPACDALWTWESLVRDAANGIAEDLTTLALSSGSPSHVDAAGSNEKQTDDQLKLMFRHLAKEHGGPECSADSAHRHLSTALAQTLVDRLENADGLALLSRHGEWISDRSALPKTLPAAAHLNGLLLTAAVPSHRVPFAPGTVYRLVDLGKFKDLFGISAGDLTYQTYQEITESDQPTGWTYDQWKEKAIHVLLEISPVCDFHQGRRKQALLMAGLLVPADGRANCKRGDSFEMTPTFVRRGLPEEALSSEVFLTFCSRYKVTMIPKSEPDWLRPLFRLRDLPTSSLRNWHASHSARVGYVSFR